MTKFYQIKQIKELGKPISRNDAQQKIADQIKVARFDTRIVTIITNGYYSIAQDVTFFDAFESFQNLYVEREFIDLAYYEIEPIKLAGCIQGGWIFGMV